MTDVAHLVAVQDPSGVQRGGGLLDLRGAFSKGIARHRYRNRYKLHKGIATKRYIKIRGTARMSPSSGRE